MNSLYSVLPKINGIDIMLLSIIRPINLLMVAYTQLLVVICFIPNYEAVSPQTLMSLVIASVLIAAGGYVINDRQDVLIDTINKPHKVIIGKKISHQQALYLASTLTTVGIGFSLFCNQVVVAVSVFAALLLYLYAFWLKKMLLIGNLVVSILSALSVAMPLFLYQDHLPYSTTPLFYVVFAFLVSLFREVVKTIEDIEGDIVGNCQTLPIVIGTIPTKQLLFVLWTSILLLEVLFVTSILKHPLELQVPAGAFIFYSSLQVALLCFLAVQLQTAYTSQQFARLSQWCKLLMLVGITSMWLV